MICQKCGTQNSDSSTFCIRCGNNLSIGGVNQPVNNMNPQQQFTQPGVYQQQPQMNNAQYNQQTNVNQPINMNQQQPFYQPQGNFVQQNQNNTVSYQQPMQQNYNNQSTKMSFMDYFNVMILTVLKPHTTIKQDLDKFEDLKNPIILSLIISVIGTLASLVKTMINTVRVTSFWSDETEWVWENLKDINYIKVIGTNLLVWVGIIALLAFTYYVGSLIMKKQTKISRLLGIAAISVIPLVISAMILSPLLSIINTQLGMGIVLIGIIYTIIIIYEGFNNELQIEGNAKFYLNLVCMSVLAIAGYYVYMKFFMAPVSSDVKDILDIFS